jgi:hypothetical protein
MVSKVIWVFIYARPRREVPLKPLADERARVGAELMYIRRFRQALALSKGDRVVIHFGGPRGSDPFAGHLVRAGCVEEPARPLTQSDARDPGLKRLLDLTIQMFPDFQTAPGLFERQGIIRYRLFDPPPGVSPLPRPFPPPRPGMNFIRLMPEDPEYQVVDPWWHAVVPRGCCGKE